MIKYNEERLIKTNNNIQEIKDYSNKLSRLTSTDKEDFWKALKGIISKTVASYEKIALDICREKTEEHPGTTLANIKFIMGGKAALEEVIVLVEETEDKIAEATARIKELEQIASEIKSNIDAQ